MLSADIQLRQIEQQLLALGGVPVFDGRIVVDPGDITGNLDLDIVYPTGHRLAVFLAVDVTFGYPLWTLYSFHPQDALEELVFRYDSYPHHPDVPSFPHHKHTLSTDGRSGVIAHQQPSLAAILRELWESIGPTGIDR